LQGGIELIEVDVRSTAGIEIVEESTSKFSDKISLGATTVFDTTSARKAILAGADIISTPYLIENVVKICNRYGKICPPGALSVTEVLKVLEAGASLVKLYLSDLFGPGLLKAIKGSPPQANLISWGGVREENISDWLSAGSCAVVIDGTFGNASANRDAPFYGSITRSAQQLRDKIGGIMAEVL
jgi:2-dehydro-3-deoxyphosphogluconate aldolase/(4S)-4-hydroxy-2-oxoglutarate aldolase